MKNLFLLFVLLTGCTNVNISANAQDYSWLQFESVESLDCKAQVHCYVYRVEDTEKSVTCWIWDSGSAYSGGGGISCIPNSKLSF